MLENDRFQVFHFNDAWQTPLTVACKNSHLELVKVLISYGSDTNWRDIAGRSPLFYAIQNQDIELITVLIGNNSSCFAIDNYGSPLVPIISQKKYEQQLKKQGTGN